MAEYVFIPGAGSDSWYWHLVAGELRSRGHRVATPDLPCDDDAAGLFEYADTVAVAIDDPAGTVLVAHSFGGFTAPLVCQCVPVQRLVLLSAMIPQPGEAPGDWWTNTGYEQARREQDERDSRHPDDEDALFFHDVPAELATEARTHSRTQSTTPFTQSWPLSTWPATPTTFLLCRHDRFLPAAFIRRVVAQRLRIVPDEIDGGHMIALSRPRQLAERLEAISGFPARS
ncbi:alpha/beta fold hydrolase [Amycolatopsis taiwanensis]|uniref:Alpha/beta hydrolase n=1 Tax=Amycolatopsis taiwanensis TaxID=342230 RepID=A0A9W6R1G3_9PSEU|nr:alpha/beta hydrolase [Amycolatopsis taiwanensis]GLY67409.1 alpha/beta hydrolase [Amycolatopsis taiwanensis]